MIFFVFNTPNREKDLVSAAIASLVFNLFIIFLYARALPCPATASAYLHPSRPLPQPTLELTAPRSIAPQEVAWSHGIKFSA